jgi:hypothetical protein
VLHGVSQGLTYRRGFRQRLPLLLDPTLESLRDGPTVLAASGADRRRPGTDARASAARGYGSTPQALCDMVCDINLNTALKMGRGIC